jgi:hypothetical protein
MHSLKGIRQEILQQHRQLSFNRRELNLRRGELRQRLHQGLRSRGLLLCTFTAGLMLGWLTHSARSLSARHGHTPLFKGLKTAGHWLTPFKGAVWSGLIKTATGYTADKISGELHEHYDQRG